MINEKIILKKKYFDLSAQLIEDMNRHSWLVKDKLVIGVCGESGSGKSVTAKCLKILLEERNIKTSILHQDSYFILPPKENHAKRQADISWVGPNEVQLELLQQHINQFKSHQKNITVPVVDYENNSFSQYELDLKNTSVLIVEGVYSFLQNQLDYKIFIERTYKETQENRKKRSREIYDPFVEQVLSIEHGIIAPLKNKADVLIRKDYSIKESKNNP